jgi:hypothetical protein
MAVEDSHNVIKAMNDEHEADSYIAGLLKDPAMRADMEQAGNPYNHEAGILPPAPSAPEMER